MVPSSRPDAFNEYIKAISVNCFQKSEPGRRAGFAFNMSVG